MTITVTNQKPAVLDPVHTITCTGAYDPVPAIKSAIADPLRTPLNPAAPAKVTDAKGNDLSGGIEQALLACLGDTLVPEAEDFMKELLGQTMVNYDQTTSLPVGELFAAQAGRKHKLPAPVPGRVVYTAREDVIPSAKGLLSGTSDADLFFASLAFAYHPDTLGFWFQSEAAFNDFKVWLAQQVHMTGSMLPTSTNKLLNDFVSLELKSLTESLLLRQSDADNNEELSFARLIVHLLMQYVEQQNVQLTQASGMSATSGVLPFTVGEIGRAHV